MTPGCRLWSRASDESGSALLVAIIVMALMLTLGLASLAMTDTQTSESGVERVRESAFNLAEGALQQQSFLLGGRGWPRAATPSPPSLCDQSSTSTFCPTPAALVPSTGSGAYEGVDYSSGASWTTWVRDNSGVDNQVYTDTVMTNPTWDANGDGYIWVRAAATVQARTRTIVALLKRDPIPILLPKAVLVAGRLAVGQNGQSPVITTDGTTPPVLRCAGDGCANYIQSGGKKDPQISPDTVSYNPPGFPDRLIAADTISKLVDSATVFTSCPTPAQAQGIVVIDVSDGTLCKFTGNTNFNSAAAPGIVIMRRGTLELSGNGQFHGMILHLNEAGRDAGAGAADCVQITGTVDLYGGIVIEGRCGFYIQGNARLNFAPNNLNFSLTGVAGLVQNTWRELPSY